MSSWCPGEREADPCRGARPAIRPRLRRHDPRRARRGRGELHQPRRVEDGYHYGSIVTFATPQARDAYLNDPNHRPVAEAIGAAAERIVVFDI
jgi:Stress responsive A/B Barrel Domain